MEPCLSAWLELQNLVVDDLFFKIAFERDRISNLCQDEQAQAFVTLKGSEMSKQHLFLLIGLAALSGSAMAVEYCEVDGKEARSADDLVGKNSTLRCKDGVTNTLIYEKEVRNGQLIGNVKEYNAGILVKDYFVNAKAAYDGLFKEYRTTNGKAVLIKELTYKNGAPIGISRSFSPMGGLKRISFNAGGNREEAFAEFTSSGKLSDLACANRPVFSPHLDDALWCGHKGAPVSISFYGEDGLAKSKNVFENGERRQRTILWNNGQPQSDEVGTLKGGIDRTYYESGAKKREMEWVYQGANRARVTIVDLQYDSNGTLVSDRKWRPVERGTQPISVATWYPSGQPKMKSDFVLRGAPPELVRREVIFHENGKIAGQGMWGTNGQQDTTPRGVTSKFNEDGVLVMENTYNDRGEVIRERDFDNKGKAIRDNEITPDGQRISLINGGKSNLPKGLVPTAPR